MKNSNTFMFVLQVRTSNECSQREVIAHICLRLMDMKNGNRDGVLQQRITAILCIS